MANGVCVASFKPRRHIALVSVLGLASWQQSFAWLKSPSYDVVASELFFTQTTASFFLAFI